MKRTCNKTIAVLLICMVCLCALLPPQAQAAGAVEPEKPVTLTIVCSHESRPLPGVSFALFRVADVNAYAEFTLCGDFAAYPVRLDGLTAEDWRSLAATLAAYAARDRLAPLDAGQTGADGTLRFPQQAAALTPGLYLAVGQQLVRDGMIYSVEPFLVSLPNLDEATDTWLYDVRVSPKIRADKQPVNPPAETVDRKVLKVWKNDAADTRPASIRVQLLKDGAVYETVTLDAAANWRHTWEKLPKYNKDGTLIRWTVAEITPDGYTVLVTQEGVTSVVTNTAKKTPAAPSEPQKPAAPSGPRLPQTGVLWWPVPLLAAAGLICLLLSRRMRKKG